MLAEMSSREVSEWMAFCEIEPLPDDRADYHAAMVVSALYNIYRDKKKYPTPFDESRFLPRWSKPEPEKKYVEDLSLNEQRSQLQLWAMMFGGRFSA